jgi:hypothetical protein
MATDPFPSMVMTGISSLLERHLVVHKSTGLVRKKNSDFRFNKGSEVSNTLLLIGFSPVSSRPSCQYQPVILGPDCVI